MLKKITSVPLTAPKNPTNQLGTHLFHYWQDIHMGLKILNIPGGERRISSNTRTLWHSPIGRCLGSQPMCRRAPWAKKNTFQHPKLGRRKSWRSRAWFWPMGKNKAPIFFCLIFEGSTRFRHPHGRTLSVAPSFQWYPQCGLSITANMEWSGQGKQLPTSSKINLQRIC